MTKEGFNRWVPIFSGIILIASTVLRAKGRADVAGVIETVGSVGGLTADPQLPWADLGGAVVSVFSAVGLGYGALRKLWFAVIKPAIWPGA